MNSGEFEISAEALIKAYVYLLYVPACLITCWTLVRRLSAMSRFIACTALVFQIIVVLVSLDLQPNSYFERWQWALGQEWNIPSIISSAQFALVGIVALAMVWQSLTKPFWQRFVLVGIGLFFVFVGLEEFFSWKESTSYWSFNYIAIGLAVAIATVITAIRSPRHLLKWYICMLSGLSLIAMGALLLDSLDANCGRIAFVRIDGCLYYSLIEEVSEFLGGWLTLVAMLGLLSDAMQNSRLRVWALLYLFPTSWVIMLLIASPIPSLELMFSTQPASVQFESGVHLRGYRIGREQEALFVQLFATARRQDLGEFGSRTGYSVHLVDKAGGGSVASRDQYADVRQDAKFFGPDKVRLYRQLMPIEIPPKVPTNRVLWVVLSLWRQQERAFVKQKIIASNHRLLSDTQVILDELIIPALSASSPANALAQFDNGFALAAVDLPQRARSGENLIIPFSWQSDEDGREDLAQYLHLLHEESGEWFVYDQEPLGSRLPTRLWYRGLADTETWQVPLPADLEPGEYRVFTGLYRAGNQQRVPVTDMDGTPFVDARVPIGAITIEA